MVPTKSRQVTGATCVTMLTGTQRHTTKGTVKRGITVFSLSGMLPATAQLHCRDTTPHNNNNWCTFMSIYCLPQFYQVRELTHQGKLHAQAIHDVKAFVLPHICAHINDQAIVISFIYTIHVNECEKKNRWISSGFYLKKFHFRWCLSIEFKSTNDSIKTYDVIVNHANSLPLRPRDIIYALFRFTFC